MNKSHYNEEALTVLRSPEHYDTLFRVTQPMGWMALLTLCFLILSIIVWSFFGVMSVSVNAVGMIIDTSGLVRIAHDASGKINKVMVSPGDAVKKGDILATIHQPLIEADIIDAKQRVMSANNSQALLNSVANLNALMDRRSRAINVKSSCDGVVTEVQLNEGDIVNAGVTLICTIRREQNRDDLAAIMYIPLDMGKRVQPGMMIHITPSGVDITQKGSLLGVVRDVKPYPASNAGILRVLGNSDVVAWILRHFSGAAMEVRVDLVRDENSTSGYLWTSVSIEHPAVTAGSICSGRIIVERQPPIEKIFLKLSQWLRNS